MIKIIISTNNAAFEIPGGGHEMARILRLLAETYERHDDYRFTVMPIHDVNGNIVGSATYKKPRRR
jgi:hypothetical protein